MFSKKNLKIFFVAIFSILLPRSAWAYIDPGTSGFMFSFLGPIIAAVAGILAVFLRPVRDFFRIIFTKLKDKPKITLALSLILLIGGGGIYYFNSLKTGNAGMETKKVIVLGMDGLDPKIMERLMNEGQLVNFSRLKSMGGYSKLATSNPAQSPVAWSSIACGAGPGQHGIFDFIRRDPKTYMPDLAIVKFNKGVLGNVFSPDMFSPVCKGKTFWEITSEAGVPTTVIRWPITFPPHKNKAKTLAGLGVPDLCGTLGNYTLYTDAPFEIEAGKKFKIQQVSPQNGTIRAEIFGPPVGGLFKEKKASIPMTVKIGPNQALIEIEGKTYTVPEKGWSEWIELKFSAGFMKKAAGIGKFYLSSISPLKLYFSPVQISPREPVFNFTNPAAYAPELANSIGVYHTLGMPEDTNALGENCLDERAFIESCDDIMREREKMFMYELTRFEGGLLACVFDTSDRVQHTFWRFEEPGAFNPPQALYEQYKNTVEDMYKNMDRILGTTLNYVDSNTTLIVCSDHGFTSFKRAVHLNSWLAREGYMKLKTSADKDNSLFRDVIWDQTRAYALGFGTIYLNLKGREGKGLLTLEEAEILKREIIEKLSKLDDSGKPAIKKVYLNDEIYSGPYKNEGPDLIVGFEPGYRASWQTAVGGAPAEVFEDNLKPWSGDHCVDPQFVPGILFTNKKLNNNDPKLTDIAPAVLKLFRLPVPENMSKEGLF